MPYRQYIAAIELYIKGAINAILLSSPFWNGVHLGLQIFSLVLGGFLTYFLILKARADRELSKEKTRAERLSNDMKEQEVLAMKLKNKAI